MKRWQVYYLFCVLYVLLGVWDFTIGGVFYQLAGTLNILFSAFWLVEGMKERDRV